MNIDNLRKELEQVDTFTYKKLCEVLEEEYSKGGNAKKKQLEDWERYFEYEKIKTKIKILNIRNRPLPDVNKNVRKKQILFRPRNDNIVRIKRNKRWYYRIDTI